MKDNLTLKTEKAISRGIAWLSSNESKIATIGDFSAHYKAPYLYAVTGLPERARRYSDLLVRSYLTTEGDFRTSKELKGWQHLPSSPANRYIYANGWTIAGLQKTGAYGMVRRALGFLGAFQDPSSGGFFSRYDLKRGRIEKTHLDTSSTCSGALALLACAKFDEAVRAGDFLLKMIDAQPEPRRFFFTTWEQGRGILTEVFKEENPADIRGRKHFCVSAEHDAIYEMVWFLGMPMKILGRLFELTADRKYLDGAREYFNFFNRMSPERWHNNSGTKIMWGAAELFRQTGDAEFRDAAAKILEWLVDSQQESGVWVHSLWYKSIEDQPFQATLDLVQEYVSEFCDVIYDFGENIPGPPLRPDF